MNNGSTSEQTSASKLSPEDNERIFKAAKEYCATVPNACECVPFTRGAQYATEFERRPSPQQQPDRQDELWQELRAIIAPGSSRFSPEMFNELRRRFNLSAKGQPDTTLDNPNLEQLIKAMFPAHNYGTSNKQKVANATSTAGQPDELSKAQAQIRELERYNAEADAKNEQLAQEINKLRERLHAPSKPGRFEVLPWHDEFYVRDTENNISIGRTNGHGSKEWAEMIQAALTHYTEKLTLDELQARIDELEAELATYVKGQEMTTEPDLENFTDENAVLAQKFTDEVYRAMITAVTHPQTSREVLQERKEELVGEWYEYFYDHLTGEADHEINFLALHRYEHNQTNG